MGSRYVSGWRNELFARARKLFICSVFSILTKNVTASPKNISELFAVTGTHVMECNFASSEMGDPLATPIRAQAEEDSLPRFFP